MIIYKGIKFYPDFKFLLPGYAFITLFGRVYTKYSKEELESYIGDGLMEETVEHEKIHMEQAKKQGYILFYIKYLWKWIKSGFDYNKIDYEIEAYDKSERSSK